MAKIVMMTGQGMGGRAAQSLAAVLALAVGLLLPGLALAQNDAPGDSAADSDSKVQTNSVAAPQAEDSDTNSDASDSIGKGRSHIRIRHHGNGQPLVVVGHDVELKAGETAEAVVVVGGSAKIRGKVRQAAVVVGGNLDIEGGEIGEAAVVVLGDLKAGQGSIIHGDAVTVGGEADVAEGAKIEGERVDTGKMGLPHVEWLKNWFVHCLLKMRPLAPQVGWVWGVWATFLLIYVLIAAAFPRPVRACLDELNRRPATTFLMGLLSKLLLPLVLLILVATVIGIVVVPFILAALFLGLLVGKVAILEWLGFAIGRHLGSEGIQKPLAAFFLGVLIVTVLYLVPIVGLVTFGVISVWGLGCAVTAAFGSFRREMPGKPATLAPSPEAIPPVAPPVDIVRPVTPPIAADAVPSPAPQAAFQQAQPDNNPTPSSSIPPITESVPPIVPQQLAAAAGMAGAAVASLPDAWAFPKASFWERMGAAFLDVVLVSILGAVIGGPPQSFLVALAYFAGMWAWKGTTIGGIVLGLKVARLDGQPLTFTVALVRGLAAGFSIIVLFLGFLWIIWDNDRQGWHDRIAGTVVVKLPKGTPLV